MLKNHLSPIDVWTNQDIMLKVIKNRMKYLNRNLSLLNKRKEYVVLIRNNL